MLDGEYGGQRLVFHADAGGATLRGFESFAEHPGYGLLVEHDLGGEQGLVAPGGTDVGFPGNIGGAKRGDNAGFGESRSDKISWPVA